MRVLALSDTHLTPTSRRGLPAAVLEEVARADVILHAGDVVHPFLLEELGRHAPVHAVLGNNDVELDGSLPGDLVVDLDGVRVGLVHDSGPRKGREARLRRRFPDADLVVFGHSHIPWDAEGVDGQWLLNPGSPTQRRRQPHPTMGVVELADGRIERTEILAVDVCP